MPVDWMLGISVQLTSLHGKQPCHDGNKASRWHSEMLLPVNSCLLAIAHVPLLGFVVDALVNKSLNKVYIISA